MALPRISIIVEDEDSGEQGFLGILALGFGIHIAWLYLILFQSATMENAAGQLNMVSPLPLAFIISTIAFLLFFSATDQKHLTTYTAKWTIGCWVGLAVLGSIGLMFITLFDLHSVFLAIVSGVILGFASSGYILLWGTAYARYDSTSIVINFAAAAIIGLILSVFLLNNIPAALSAIIAVLLPLLEMPLIWKLTPISYAVRHTIPIFNSLPVQKPIYALRLLPGTIILGFVLGFMHLVYQQTGFLYPGLTSQLLIAFAGSFIAMVILVAAFSLSRSELWEGLLRFIIPVICVCLVAIAFITKSSSTSLIPPIIFTVGYLCLEAGLLSTFSETSQEFRISPIFNFCLGNAGLFAGYLVCILVQSAIFPANGTPLVTTYQLVLALILLTVIGHALTPTVRDVKRLILLQNDFTSDFASNFNILAYQRGDSSGNPDADDIDPAFRGGAVSGDGGRSSGRRPSGGAKEEMLGAAATGTKSNYPEEELIGGGPDSSLGSGSAGQGHQEPIIRDASDIDHIPDADPLAGLKDLELRPTSVRMDIAQGDDQSSELRGGGRFRMQCEIIANRYLLSRRETEVMFLLARGYNAAYIQDKLCISRSTAKTHIGHIYRKLDIHSQHELLKMIDEAEQ